MNNERLVIMANQIGDFYESFPDSAEAKKEIADHLNKFWALSMRRQILAHVQQQQETGLHPMVGEAIKEHLTHLG